jgi:Flp pilus assembly protein TadG
MEQKNKKGQVILEFMFCMFVLFFMIYGIIEIFRWTGTDMAQARRAHEDLLKNRALSSEAQIDPDFYTPSPFRALVGE